MDKLEEILKKIQDEVTTLVEKIKSGFSKKASGEESSVLEESEDKTESQVLSDENLEEKKLESDSKFDIKNIKLDSEFFKKNGIKIFVGVAIALMAIDEFFLKSEPEQVPQQNVVIRKKSKPKRKKLPVKKRVKKMTEKSPVERKVKEPAKDSMEVKKTPVKEVVAKNEKKSMEKVENKGVIKAKVKDIPPETSTVILEKPKKENNMKETKTTSDQSNNEDVMFDLNIDKKEMALGEKGTKENKVEELSNKLESVISNNMKEEEKSPDYIEPPTYQRFGRGLVYNCKGKHWACVDYYSYVKCRENDKFNTENKKDKECVVRNTYASSDDCIKVQTYFTNNNEKTDFCSVNM